MIKILLISLILLISPVAHAMNVEIGEAAPDFTLMTVEGEVASLSDYKDNILVFVYFKQSQKRSILALKDAYTLSKAYTDKGVTFIGITSNGIDKESIKKLLDDNRVHMPVLIDKARKVYSSYGIRVYPTTVLVGKDGMILRGLPGHPLTYSTLLEGYIRSALGEIDKEELSKLLSPDKEEADPAALEAGRHYNLAMKFTASGLIDQAILTAKKSIESKPDIARSHILLGFLLLKNKETDLALESFNNALRIEPDSKDAKTGLGEVYIQKGETDKAIEILNSATIANPYSQMAYYKLAKAYGLKGDKDKSIEMYNKAIRKIFSNSLLPSSAAKCR
jgi:cytochrome c biogenesis protein CcmG/thiol:disulfide interchange protein DsbE